MYSNRTPCLVYLFTVLSTEKKFIHKWLNRQINITWHNEIAHILLLQIWDYSEDKINGMVKYMYLMSMIKGMHIILQLTICDYNETVSMLAFYSTSHYSTSVCVWYILQHYIKIVNQGRTCGNSTTNPHIDRKGKLRKYSRVLVTL